MEKTGLDRERPSYRLLQIGKTFLTVCVGYVLFRSESLQQAGAILTQMFTDVTIPKLLTFSLTTVTLDWQDWNLVMLCLPLLIYVDIARARGRVLRDEIAAQGLWFRWLIWLAGLFAVLLFGVYGPAYDASSFIYFGF